MPRTPTAARRARRDDFDDEGDGQQSLSPRKQVSLAASILEKVEAPRLGRPPQSDEEKRQVLQTLVYLKAARKTHQECASALDVSERTISTYLADPLYKELQDDLQAVAKQQGHVTIAVMIEDALDKMFELMHSAKSEFVSYKAAEKLLDVAGYNLPREEQHRDNQRDLDEFMGKLAAMKGANQTQVNVTITTEKRGEESQVEVIEGETVTQQDQIPTEVAADPALPQRSIPPELARYYETVQPGGRLPGAPPPTVGRDGQAGR